MRAAVLLSVLWCTVGCTSIRTLDVAGLPTYTLDAIRASPAGTLGRAVSTEPKAFVVRLRKGDALPLELHASLGPIAVQAGRNVVVFAEDTWLYVSAVASPDFMLLSRDGKQWAPVSDTHALGRLYGLTTGTVQFGFGVPEGKEATLSLVLERK